MVLTSLRLKWLPEPLAAPGSYDGQRVLVVGGTAGLGLASAVHFINLGASEAIITARSEARGQAARASIEAQTGTEKRVKVLELDMRRYASVVAFVTELKQQEEDIQVNALSKTLLGLLLLDWMKSLRSERKAPAHLVFVTSGAHMTPDVGPWVSYHTQGGILKHFSQDSNFQGAVPHYAVSKLLMQYAYEEVVKMALCPDDELQVIVNSICPGPTATELNRSMAAASVLYRLVAPVAVAVLGQAVDVGARTYVAAGLTSPAEHGKFLRRWATDEEYASQAAANLGSLDGREAQRLVWQEIRDELTSQVPEVRTVLNAGEEIKRDVCL